MAPFELKLSDPPPSRHARPIGERIKEIRRKWDVIRIMMNSRRHRRWLHPVTRQLAARYANFYSYLLLYYYLFQPSQTAPYLQTYSIPETSQEVPTLQNAHPSSLSM